MSKNRYDFVFRFRTIAAIAIGLFVLTSTVTAEVVERYNAEGDLTASGTDVGAVQLTTGFSEGDVIKLSGTATHNISIPYQADKDYHILKFTIQSATPGVKQTINAGLSRFYNFNDGAKTYNVTLKDLDYQGNDAIITKCIGIFFHSSSSITMNLTLDNVSFTGFKETEYTGAVFGFDNGTLNINASNGVVFDGNRAEGTGSGEYRGGAINVSQSGSLTINVDEGDVITFKNNYAKTCGSAINVGQKKTQIPATINGNSLFESNSVGSWGGAVHVWGALTFNGNTTFTSNSGAASDGGAIRQEGDAKYTLKFNGDVTMTGNTAPSASGGAICSNGITMVSDSINFTNNSAKTFGGAIRVTTGDLSMKANSISFEGNHVSGNDGGAFQVAGNVSITGTGVNPVVTFNKNYSAYVGGAISCKALTLTTGTFNFTNNYDTVSSSAYSYGGAVYCTSMTTNATEIKFDSNTSRYYGGGLAVAGSGGTIQADKITFNNNKASYYGGAIHTSGGTLTIKGDDVKFTDNSVTSANGDGGAIRGVNNAAVVFTGLDEESAMLFSGNTSIRYGGALSVSYITMSTGSFTFKNNSTGTQGGAIYAANVYFSGDNTVGTFTENSAGAGNDIYLIDANSVLSFQDAGTYSFDGGICLAAEGAQTVINQAQVTIAGRANDNSNVYQLQKVSVSNGGELSAQLDNIDSLTGNFTIGGSQSAVLLSLNELIASIKSSTGDESAFTLVYGSIDPDNSDSLVITSGRLDIKGSLTSDLTVKDLTTFSPGNSVGKLILDGDFTAESGSTLLFEQDQMGIDQLIIQPGGTLNIADDSILELAMTSPNPGAKYLLIKAEDGLPSEYTNDFWNGLLTPQSAYVWNLFVEDGVLYASIDPNAVPEPSAWALLALGTMGLLYWRKKSA